jgi:hypothetical protein
VFHTTHDFPLLLGDGSTRAAVPPPAPPPPAGDGTAALFGFGRAGRQIGSDLPTTAGLLAHLDASEPLVYPGEVLPADGATVDGLPSVSLAPGGATEWASFNRPIFAADFDGAGRRALRFQATQAHLLAMPYVVGGPLRQLNLAVSMLAVLRVPATVGATQRLVNISRSSWTDGTSLAMGFILTATQILWRMRVTTNNTDGAVAGALAAGETVILVGQHGPTGYQNRLSVRRGGATSVGTATATNDADYRFSNFPDRAYLGGGKNASGDVVGEHFDGWLAEFAIWNALLSDAQITELIASRRAKWGIA